jgi:hypothetical protein
MGARKNGSTDNRVDDTKNSSHNWFYCGVDGSGIFEVYVETASEQEVWLVGYFGDEATFQTNGTDVSLSSKDTWLDIDISSITGGETAIAAFVETDPGWGFGLRKNGSSDDRYASPNIHNVNLVGCDGSEIFEGYITSTTQDFWVLGWLTSDATFNTNGIDISLGTTNSWLDLTALSSEDAIAGAIEVYCASTKLYGLRKNGSSEDIYRYTRHSTAVIECDGSQVIEGKIQSTDLDFFELGYFTAAGGTTYYKTITGALTFVGSLAKKTKTALAGTLTSSGALTKLTKKGLAGVLTSAGALSSIVVQTITLTGSITPSGILSKLPKKSLTGDVTPTGALTKLTKKGLVGVFTPSGSIAKKSAAAFSGAVTFVGDLAGEIQEGAQTFYKTITGTLTPSGAITKKTEKGLSGAVTFAGGLATLLQRTFYKALSGAVTFGGSVVGVWSGPAVDTPLPYGYGAGGLYGKGFQYGYGWLGFEKDIANDYLVSKLFGAGWSGQDLVQSYTPEYVQPGYPNTIKRCMIWDSALSVIAFVLNGYVDKAADVLTALESLQEVDGSFTSEMNADTGDKTAAYHSAIASLVAYAAALYQQQTSLSTFETMMTDACDWVESLMDATHDGVAAESGSSNYPTVVNVLAYYAFRECYRITSTAQYDTDADDVKAFILGYLWNEPIFYQDVGDDTKNLLAQVFGALFLESIYNGSKNALLANIFGEFLTEDTIRDIAGLDCFEGTGSTLNITEPQLSFTEGTILAALMSHKVGAYGNREAYISEMMKVQNVDKSHYGAGLGYGAGLRYGFSTGYDGGLLHSSQDRYDFYEYFGAGATAMLVIYACCVINDNLNQLVFNYDD